MELVQQGEQLLLKLRSEVETKQFNEADRTVGDAKILLTQFPGLSAAGQAIREKELARAILEQGVLLSAWKDDRPAFQRHMTQLRIYYFDYSAQLAPSELHDKILGLNLLYLLTENRLAEFHSELELIDEASLDSPAVKFVTEMEQALMMGSYGRVLGAGTRCMEPVFAAFLASLVHTVREAVAECAKAAYKSLTLDSAKEVLMFSTAEEVAAYIQQTHPEWQVQGNTITFAEPEITKKSSEIPSLRLISEALSYATELERIV